MHKRMPLWLPMLSSLLLLAGTALAAEPMVQVGTPDENSDPAANYQRYCTLCHGADRQGHANDHAPSLRSMSLLESAGARGLREAIAYGRPGTAMGGYLDEIGGPMDAAQIGVMVNWLLEVGKAVPVTLQEPGAGDADRGAAVYAANCRQCHGANGEGGAGTALANPTMLALNSNAFLRHAIVHGRQDTPMPAFATVLDDTRIDDVVAYLRGRGSDWTRPTAVAAPPALENLVLNPGAAAPTFALTDGTYVAAAELHRELDAGKAMVLLDTRVATVWRQGHIAGAAPLPYYSADEVLAKLPRDGTWIVAYCECPRAAAESVVSRLRGLGFLNTAVLYEGFQGWAGLGYPVVTGAAN